MSSINNLAHAVVATERNRVEFLPVKVPSLGPDDISIRVEYSWISNGTESSFIRGERIAGDTPLSATDPLPFPHVPGYQKCGVIEAIGEAVTDFAIGDRVFATVSRVEEMFYDSGGHVSPAITTASQVWKLPDNVSSLAASGLVLTQVGYNCGIRPSIEQGDAVVVLGDGMVGHWAAQTLAYRGARVLLAGRHDERLALYAFKVGDLSVNTRQQNLLEAAREWAPEGIQAVIDTVGSIADIESLYPAMKHGGHIVSAGFYGEAGQIDIQPMRNRELTLHAPAGWSQERMDATLQLLASGDLRTEHLITHRFAVSDAAKAYELILARKEPVLGVVLDWSDLQD